MTKAIAVEAIGIGKRFGPFTALADVSLKIAPATVHALLGENGAGKSTLVKCLLGYYRADDGSFLIDGREETIARPMPTGWVWVWCTSTSRWSPR
jgi:simple sugar transport system ATP-binding protein